MTPCILFFSPEQLRAFQTAHHCCSFCWRAQENKGRAELAYSEAVDAWAAGVLAYELLVGR
jgi:hypothetical protein